MRTSITENGAGRENRYLTFAYDKLYRLTSETDSQRNGGAAVVYTYDDFGNRLTRTDLSTTLYSTSKATMIYSSKRRRGKNVAEMWHFRLESATLGENRQQWTKKNGNPSLSSDSRNFGKKMVGIERFELSTF